MAFGRLPLGLFALLLVAGAVRADGDDLRQALALQRAMQKVIARAEPSIACILVSRSDAYHRLAPAPTKPAPGELGTFDKQSLNGLNSEEQRQLSRQLDLADPDYVPQAFGSGVVIEASGLILTNYHVVQEATKIYVRLPGGKASYADIHAADPRCDLAVLRVLNRAVLPLTPLPLGDGDRLERGQFVLTLANPFAAGFRDGQPSASWGILSNIRRRTAQPVREDELIKPLHHYGTLLQTDARLTIGCSGGALLNLQGELVGLTTSLAALHGGETPGGFALPVNIGMRRLLDVLKRGEEIEYGFLGVSFDRSERGDGVVIKEIQPGSPADIEGRLRAHDVLVAIDGVPLHDVDDLFTQLGTHLAGDRVRFLVRSASRPQPTGIDVTLARFYTPGKIIASSPGTRPIVRGLRVDYSSIFSLQAVHASRQRMRPPPIPAGVFVSEVVPGSAAEQAHLKAGDVISHVAGRPVTTPAAFYQALAVATGPVELTLHNFTPSGPSPRIMLK